MKLGKRLQISLNIFAEFINFSNEFTMFSYVTLTQKLISKLYFDAISASNPEV